MLGFAPTGFKTRSRRLGPAQVPAELWQLICSLLRRSDWEAPPPCALARPGLHTAPLSCSHCHCRRRRGDVYQLHMEPSVKPLRTPFAMRRAPSCGYSHILFPSVLLYSYVQICMETVLCCASSLSGCVFICPSIGRLKRYCPSHTQRHRMTHRTKRHPAQSLRLSPVAASHGVPAMFMQEYVSRRLRKEEEKRQLVAGRGHHYT